MVIIKLFLTFASSTGITRHVPIPPLKADTTKAEPEKTEGDAKKAASEIAK